MKTPIGIADTAIGGQRIEEFMNNKSYTGAIACPDAVGAKEVRTAWNGQLFGETLRSKTLVMRLFQSLVLCARSITRVSAND